MSHETNPESSSTISTNEHETVLNGSLKKIEATIERQQLFSGPLPPPEIIQGYENVVPGSGERILAMAEKQQEHRLTIEKQQQEHQVASETKLINNEIRLNYLGLICAFFIAVFGLSGSIYLGLKDKPVASAILSGGTLASLVGVFISGRSKIKQQQRLEQEQESN